MKAVEFNGIGVRHPLINRRIPTFKEWVVRRGRTEAVDHFFWALKDITFALEQGETLGVIGSNGAGKSTLLRVAAGIITPSTGEAIIRGSLAPLIELGTGFDAELSGRENIFFNAALLGRSRSEVRRKVEEIVDFAGLDEFIDAPLRTYSTGMVARLAFSIATTIDPDVLLLDEILSVGDAAFKKKSRQRIKSFWKRGTTIMLVSHELHTVKELCAKAAWIEHGEIRAFGPSEDVIKEYTQAVGVVMETRETVEV